MSTTPDIDVLVEGFDDRDFMKGLLPAFGWKDLGTAGGGRYRAARNREPDIGVFFFSKGEAKETRFARLHQVQGKPNLSKREQVLLVARSERLVVLADSDTTGAIKPPQQHQTAATLVHRIFLGTPRPSSPSLPEQQTLERIIVAALDSIDPTRAAQVAAWLAARENVSTRDDLSKAFAWTHLAGWHNHLGLAQFMTTMGADPNVHAELKRSLVEGDPASSIWEAMEQAFA